MRPLVAMKNALIAVCLLACCACTSHNYGDTPMPGRELIDVRKTNGDGTEGAVLTPADLAKSPEDAAAVLKSIEERNQRFNQKLQSIATAEKGAQAQPRGAKGGAEQEKQKFTIDLFDADILDVVRLFMAVLEENYTVDAKVGGRVTLHVDDQFSRDQLVDLLQGVLRMQGAAMVKNNDVWEIIPLSDAPVAIGGDRVILPEEGVTPARGQVVQGFRLRYVQASELVNVIKPYMSGGALLYANDPAGVLLVCDYPHAQTKIQKLIELFDVSVFADLKLKVYALKFALAADVVKELDSVAKGMGLSDPKAPSQVTFINLDRLNMICALARNPQYLSFADAWVEELDRATPQFIQAEHGEDIFVYYCQNGDAKEIVDAMQGIFAEEGKNQKSAAKPAGPEPGRSTPIGQQITEAQAAKPPAALEQGPGAVSGSLTGPVSFVVDETTNTIIIKANGSDYKRIKELIDKLDIYPKQVLIEVVIAEVNLDDSTKLGVEWNKIFDLSDGNTASIGTDSGLGVVNTAATPLISSGLSVIVAGERLTAALKAFAQDNRVHILSSPHILASNHKEAKINVGQEVPIVTSELRTTEASSTAQTVDKTVQYRDTGIILTVKPHINDKGLVRMEIEQEVSSISEQTVDGVDSPVFNNRVATSTLVCNSEQTVVIGGLIQHTRTYNQNGVPGVSRLPLLKYLFGYEADSYSSQELLIFITPHVMERKEDADLVSKGFLDRLEQVKTNFR